MKPTQETDEEQLIRLECPGCTAEIFAAMNVLHPVACEKCRKLYPPSLLKATCDTFDYALRLRTGELVRFTEAEICGEFAVLTLHDGREDIGHECPRGLDVRISDIVWCADAPDGS